MIKPVLMGVVLSVLVALSSPVIADVTLGTAGDPNVQLNNRLASLWGAERRALRSLGSEGKLASLVDKEKVDPFYSQNRLKAMSSPRGGKQWECLSEALYFEARGESLKGIFGVAEVILNRVDHPRYPSTVCKVVNQGTGERYRCQFSYTCDGEPENIRDQRAFNVVGKIAKIMVDGAPRELTKGATHYHTKSVKPKWAKVFPRTTTIGFHHFYRQPDRIASR